MSGAPSKERYGLESRRSVEQETAKGPDDREILGSAVVACSQNQIIALSIKMGLLKASISVDTGAAVNVLSEERYLPVKRLSRGSRWSLNSPKRLKPCGFSFVPKSCTSSQVNEGGL